MKKFKLDRNTSTRISSLIMSGVLFVSMIGMSGCKSQTPEEESTAIVVLQDDVDLVKKGISDLFPTMNKEVVSNSALIILLDEIAKEDENGKISADVIANFKAKIDADNMMGDFNSFLDTLEQAMIDEQKLISVSNLVIEKDEQILSKIESITSKIINGAKEDIKVNFNLIYTLFVLEDEITYDGLTFDVRELSYSSRAIASAYARTAAYYSRNYISEEEYKSIDNRTNNQNNKAYIKSKLQVLDNEMIEKSEVEINELFTNKYSETKKVVTNKINISDADIKNLVDYINLEYLNSDRVADVDKNNILGEYDDSKVSNTLMVIDAIAQYNMENQKDLILFSNMIVNNYKEMDTGKVDKVLLDYIQFNSIMLLNTTTEKSTSEEIFNNPYFQNIYLYFTKQNFTHKYNAENIVDVNYQDISDGAKFVANEIVLYVINKRPNIKKYSGYEEKVNKNLEESIQYIQNVITGECEKVDVLEFVK